MPDVFLYKGEQPNRNDVRLRPEDVTIDKWNQQPCNPILRVLPIAAVAASFFFVPIVTQAEDVTLDKWYQPTSQPVRARQINYNGGEFRTEVVTSAENITLDKWYQQPSEPVRPKLRQQPSGEYRFEIPRTILLSDWFQAASEPVRAKRRDSNTGEFKFELPRAILLSDWYQQASEPTRRLVRQVLGGDVRTDIIPQSLDEWGQPTSQPYFTKRRDPNTGEFRYEIPRDILLTDWFIQASEPVRAKVRQLLGGESRTEVVSSAEVITMDKWFNQTSQPYFTKRRDPFTGEFRFEVPRSILISDWFQPANEPIRRKIIYPQGGEARTDIVVAEVITIDKWGQPVSQPVRRRPTDVQTGQSSIAQPVKVIPQGNGGVDPLRCYSDGYLHSTCKHTLVVAVDGWIGFICPPPTPGTAAPYPTRRAEEGGRYHEKEVDLSERIRMDDEEIMLFIKLWLRCRT